VDLRQQLDRVNVRSVDDVRAVQVGRKVLLDPFFRRSPAPPNSDYFPFMDNRAARARYLNLTSVELMQILLAELPISEMLDGAGDNPAWAALTIQNPSGRSLGQLAVRGVLDGLDDVVQLQTRAPIALVRASAADCGAQMPLSWQLSWMGVARFTARYIDADKRTAFWNKVLPERCRARLDATALRWFHLYVAVAAQDARGMVEYGRQVFATESAEYVPLDVQYVGGVLVLGHLALGQVEQAAAVFGELPKRLPPGTEPTVELRWLEMITASRLGGR
jgi:hypothetical protein